MNALCKFFRKAVALISDYFAPHFVLVIAKACRRLQPNETFARYQNAHAPLIFRTHNEFSVRKLGRTARTVSLPCQIAAVRIIIDYPRVLMELPADIPTPQRVFCKKTRADDANSNFPCQIAAVHNLRLRFCKKDCCPADKRLAIDFMFGRRLP